VTVSCPDLPGKSLSFRANVVGGDPTARPTYTWKVSGGKISAGQGTAEINVDAEGEGNYTATVEVGGYAASCRTATSCSLFICPAPSPRMVDEFGDITPGQEESRLDSFAAELRNDPSAQGHIIVHAGERGRRGEAAGRAVRMRSYLVRRHGLVPERVVAVGVGSRKTFSVQLWMVPAGATPPKATSTLVPGVNQNKGPRPTREATAPM
jgi:hypothetical protein